MTIRDIARTDEMIKTDIVDQLYWDDRIDASDITVEVDDGAVTLSGTVPTYTAKQAASSNTWMVEGVSAVINTLDVEYEETIEIPTDEQIESNVRSKLLWNPDLLSYKINVDVNSGWVTLEGTVDAYWEKMRAENEASEIRGVVGVTNKLAVAPTENITDERIAEAVVNSIDRNLRVNVDDVNVIVENGEVTLTGTVPTWAAKSAAYNAALYTMGVTKVDNNIVVTLTS